MAIRQPSAPTAEKPAETAAPAAPAAQAPMAEAPKDAYQKVAEAFTGEQRKVRGQVRMHAIIAGYTAAARLAPTLATTPATVKEELHKMAAEIAAKVESYSFLE